MSTLLWQSFFDSDVDRFRHVLARASYNASTQNARGGTRTGNAGLSSSPGAHLAISPTLTTKGRKQSEPAATTSKTLANVTLSRAEINWRDSKGVTLLHEIASSTSEHASGFAAALLEQSMLDLYTQDEESGWTALHRALYFGNISIARALMDRDIQDTMTQSTPGTAHTAGDLIKIKDWEGNSPFDVYGASIANRTIRQVLGLPSLDAQPDEDEGEMAQGISGDVDSEEVLNNVVAPRTHINGDEVFAFGSNKNFTLGFGDEDDRQYPERILLKRPGHLLCRLHREYEALKGQTVPSSALASPPKNDRLPAIVRHRPMVIQDVQLSKLHSAVLTTDPEANLYTCGFGSGGRLGTGDEATRFSYVSIYGGALLGKKVIDIGLGQDHTIAISSEGETFTWGNNTYGQLGYSSNTASLNTKEDKLVQLLPRQVFGPVKREIIVGAAASRLHSVVFTSVSLFTFGKNEGQLGLVDSDARSLAIQVTPRKVAASLFTSTISSVTAIDRATICLLSNHDVWIFANYGYTKVSFPLDSSNYFLHQRAGSTQRLPIAESRSNQISKITAGGDTICAMSSMGDVFTIHVSQKFDSTAASSTTNPAKIRGALSSPQRVWSLKKSHMAVRDVDVGQDGSVIICTESGSVWRRIKRAKIKDASVTGLSEYRAKDYKFSRVPRLTRIAAVRSNLFGGFAAIRRDCNVLKTQIEVEANTIWKEIYPLLSFSGFGQEDSDTEEPAPRFWTPSQPDDVATIRRGVLSSSDLEQEISSFIKDQPSSACDIHLGTTLAETKIPVHEWMLGGRSEVMRNAFKAFRTTYFFSMPEILSIEYDREGKITVQFHGLDFITVLNLVLYLYTDSVVDVWHHTKHAPQSAYRYRQIRVELMKLASHLEMRKLEQAVRVMSEPPRTLNEDLQLATRDQSFFDDGDIEIEMNGGRVKVHSALMCQRCPFFKGLFDGRAAGRWLSTRREELHEAQNAVQVDFKHVEPHVFDFVLQYLYADADERMFDDVVMTDLDSLLDLILEVMAVANELMLDRLSQSCQKMLGRYVDTRNVCQLLNAVAPCSVTEFKDAALEYICLNLEGMLENHLLNELDDDLMAELDVIVRQNQLNCLPISKSGRADAELLESHPELVESIERSKRIKIDAVSLQCRLFERESKSNNASKARADLLEDFEPASSLRSDRPQSSKRSDSDSKSPHLKAKKSAADFMFAMDDSDESDDGKRMRDTQSRHKSKPITAEKTTSNVLQEDGISYDGPGSSMPRSGVPASLLKGPGSYEASSINATASQHAGSLDKKPWVTSTSPMAKLDMKQIMAQASSNRISSISNELGPRDGSQASPKPGLPAKMSQKERKRQQQQSEKSPRVPSAPSPEQSNIHSGLPSPASPWQIATRGPKVNLKDVLNPEDKQPVFTANSTARTPSPMTLRQTVSGRPAVSAKRAISGPSQPSPSLRSQQCRASSSQAPSSSRQPSTNSTTAASPVIQSIRHVSPPVEPALQLSMADILSQQQTEKEIIREAAAKRSLQEIQEEQAFQEWWDQESRRFRAEEEAAENDGRGGSQSSAGRGKGSLPGRGSRGGKGRGGFRGRGRGAAVQSAPDSDARSRRKSKEGTGSIEERERPNKEGAPATRDGKSTQPRTIGS